jgi:HEAT repeat protein
VIDRRAVALAGHTGDVATAEAGLIVDDPGVRATALGALARLGVLRTATLQAALGDPAPEVRRRAAELAARDRDVDLRGALADREPAVVEVAAWACGEHEDVDDDVLATLVALAGGADDALVREAAVAALGAVGDDRGLDAILAATGDRPAIRRRAVLALAPFVAPDHRRAADVAAALGRAAEDRDWQVRQAAEDVGGYSGNL